MSNQSQDDGRECTSHQQDEKPNVSDHAESPVGSLASQSSSSLSRQARRIIELLPDRRKDDNNSQSEEWRIGEEFYQEDVIAEDQPMPGDDRSDHSDELVFVDDRDLWEEAQSSEDEEEEESDDDGFVLPQQDQQSESEVDEENEAPNYDTTLPIGHHYLGENLEEARGRQIIAENSVITLPLINMQHIVLLPGQLLPISTSILNPRIHMYLKDCITSGTSLLGLMSNPRENPIGTTAEIRSYSRQEDELRIIMEGRQRFEMLSPPFETLIEGMAKLLPEISLGRPYHLTPSTKRFLSSNASTYGKMIVSKHPKYLLKQYELYYLVKKIQDQIGAWCKVDTTSNPNDFSYWVAANLPISNQERMQVLKFSCTEERLLWLKDMLERCEYFGCRYCRNVICHRGDMFLMSCSGPQNSFVNSHGFVHDTLTVRVARGLMREYDWTTEFSWFPGYAWKVACCENCSRHIGWCYKSLNADVKPKRFYGLSRANLRLQASDQERIEVEDLSLVVF